jgi:hypothetical protein
MIKRTLSLAVVAGLVGAGLILGGTAVIGRTSPVSAAQLPALIAAGSAEASGSATLPIDSGPSAHAPAGAAFSASAGMQPVADPALKVTIAELQANPSVYLGRLIASAGRATRLSDSRLLINDGTGQIIVDLEDALKQVAVTNGMVVSVEGKLARNGGGDDFDIDALSLTRIAAAAADSPAGDDPHPPTPTAGCDDDGDGDFDDDCGPDDDAPPTPGPGGGCDDDGDGDFDDDCGPDDDDAGDDDTGDDDSGDDDTGDDDTGDDREDD